MAEAKFTPGPWMFQDDRSWSGSDSIYITNEHGWDTAKGLWLASAQGKNVGPKDPDEVLANARLIAAAPELYEALKAFMDLPHLDDDVCVDARPECKVCAAINIGRSALAKAVQP